MSVNHHPRALLRDLFDAAIEAAQAGRCLPRHLPTPPRGRTLVLGAGKAAAAMARALEEAWPGELSGAVVTRKGYEVPCQRIEVLTASHPIPDEAALAATQRILALTQGLTPRDLVIFLLSGGGSSLLCAPAPGIGIEEKRELHRALLASGANISEINRVRRHLSAIKGGRLAAACHPARCCTLLLSDVPGDDPIDIASGPSVGDPTTCADALEVLGRFAIPIPPSVRRMLEQGDSESVKPGDSRLAGGEVQFIGTPLMALQAAAERARGAGLAVYILGDDIEGDAREAGTVMAGIARHAARTSGREGGAEAGSQVPVFARPCVLLSGGETTVRVQGKGRGGRNVEFLLSLALGLRGAPGVYALAGDTDGVDGNEEVAGAIVTPDTLERAIRAGVHARACLEDNDAHTFFAALGDQVVTGPTYTNVNDFRAILVI